MCPEVKTSILAKEIFICTKAAPRYWYKRFDMFILKNRFIRSKFHNYMYPRNIEQGGAIYLLLYIDYMLITCKNIEEIRKLKLLLSGAFEMNDLRLLRKSLECKLSNNRTKGYLFLSQQSYVETRAALLILGPNLVNCFN